MIFTWGCNYYPPPKAAPVITDAIAVKKQLSLLKNKIDSFIATEKTDSIYDAAIQPPCSPSPGSTSSGWRPPRVPRPRA